MQTQHQSPSIDWSEFAELHRQAESCAREVDEARAVVFQYIHAHPAMQMQLLLQYRDAVTAQLAVVRELQHFALRLSAALTAKLSTQVQSADLANYRAAG